MTNYNFISNHGIFDNDTVDSMMKLPPCLCDLHKAGLF